MIDYLVELQQLGLRKVKQKNSEQIVASCPFHKDEKPSFSFNIEKGIYHCFSCNCGGNFKQLVTQLKGKDYYYQKNYIPNPNTYKPKETLEEEEAEIDKINESIDLIPFYYFHPVALKRFNGDISLLQKFEIGFNREKKALTIPLRDEYGALRGVQLRHLGGKNKNSYLLKTNKSKILYNLHNCLDTNEIIITEGAFDVIKAYQNGYKNVVGLLGANASKTQLSLINSYFSVLNLALDNDDAGQAGVEQIVNFFSGAKIIYGWDLSLVNKKDLGELTIEEMKLLEKNRILLTRDN